MGLGGGLWTSAETSVGIGVPVGVLAAAFGGLLGSIIYRATAGKSGEAARLRRQEVRDDAAFYLEQEAQTRDPEAKKRIRDIRLGLLADYAARVPATAHAHAPPQTLPEPGQRRIRSGAGPDQEEDAW